MNTKPKSIKTIYILKLLELFLTSLTLTVMHFKGVFADKFTLVSFMMVGYTWFTLGIFYFTQKKMVTPVRILYVLDAIISIPFRAFIAIGFNVILLVLSFTSSSKEYFSNK